MSESYPGILRAGLAAAVCSGILMSSACSSERPSVESQGPQASTESTAQDFEKLHGNPCMPGTPSAVTRRQCAAMLTGGNLLVIDFGKPDISPETAVTAGGILKDASDDLVSMKATILPASGEANAALEKKLEDVSCIGEGQVGAAAEVAQQFMPEMVGANGLVATAIDLPNCKPSVLGKALIPSKYIELYIGGLKTRGLPRERGIAMTLAHEWLHQLLLDHAGSLRNPDFAGGLPDTEILDLSNIAWKYNEFDGGGNDPMGSGVSTNDPNFPLLDLSVSPPMLDRLVQLRGQERLAGQLVPGKRLDFNAKGMDAHQFAVAKLPNAIRPTGYSGVASFTEIAFVPQAQNTIAIFYIGSRYGSVYTASVGDLGPNTQQLTVDGASFKITRSAGTTSIQQTS